MKQKIDAFYKKVEKYGGWQQVPAERVYALFQEVVQPTKLGFAAGKPGIVARPVDGDIAHVLKLRPLKGAAYDICFGLSLSYVPYPYVPKLKWHRTVKSANLDLFEAPQVHWAFDGASENAEEVNPYLISVSLGDKCFREELSRAWEKSSPQANSWFEATRSLESVAQKCVEQLRRKQDGVRHLPGARLVHAFTLAKLGQREKAESELVTFLKEYQETEQASTNLRSALQGISLNA